MMAGWGTRRFAHRPASGRHHHSRVLINHHALRPSPPAKGAARPVQPRCARDVRKLAAGRRAIAREGGGAGQRRSRARRALPCRRGRGRPIAGMRLYFYLSAAPASWQTAYGARGGGTHARTGSTSPLPAGTVPER
ncbi:hypothetical protein ZWY2020_013820 [Hordeum vulgare]|nr:hypothetical protein ZWY2020_013820 [Hordeum vulgare]